MISFCNQKGGVGKSTSCVNVGARLADLGKSILLVDVDPQGALSTSTGFREIGADEPTTYELLKGTDPELVIRTVDRSNSNLEIIPTDIRLSSAEIELASVPGRDFLLKEYLSEYEDTFDYVLIDCPPTLGILTLIALTASDGVIIPVKSDFLALNGMSQLVDVIRVVKKRMNPSLDIIGVISTFYAENRRLDRQTVEQIETYFPGKLFNTKITQNVALAEAPSNWKNIFDYDARSKGAHLYEALTEEIIERLSKEGER